MKKGFTLMELIIVVIIIGILAMIGLPQYFKVTERGKAAEAFTTLGVLRNAQIRFASEGNGTTAATIGELDVTIPTLKYFSTPTVAAVANISGAGAASNIAMIQRNDTTTNYFCNISAAGAITCSGTGKPNNPR